MWYGGEIREHIHPPFCNIQVLPQSRAERYTHVNPWVCISITDPNINDANILEDNRIDILRLKFWDADKTGIRCHNDLSDVTISTNDLFNEDQAKRFGNLLTNTGI